MDLFKKIIVIVAGLVIAASTLLLVLGYRLVIDESARPDWLAITAIGTCLIPIAVAFIEISFTRKQRAIEESNARVLRELQEFRDKNKDAIEQLQRIHSGEDTLIANGGNASSL